MSNYVIQAILKNKLITDYLSTKGINPVGREMNGKLRYLCPLHQERSPSFIVYLNGEFENFYCYGCLDQNELIWTPFGLMRIYDLSAGDKVIDVSGNIQTILCTEYKNGDCIGISLGSFREPLVLTKDHLCLTIKKDNAIGAFRRLFFNSHHKCLTFRKDLASRPQLCEPKLIESNAETLEIGDYFVFPIINNKERNNSNLSSILAIRLYTKGPKVNRIYDLPATEDAAWFYGLYVAEGSVSGDRVVNLTLHLKEDHLALRAVKIAYETFGVNGIITKRTDRNTIDVRFCSSDLAAHLKFTFGDGANSKKIDGKMMWWTTALQISFLQGYKSGDGCKKDGTTVTCSKVLASGVFGIAIQCGQCPSYRKPVDEKIDSKGVFHQKWYSIGYRLRDSVNGFHETINGVEYYIMPISSITEMGVRKVVDISVSGTETFLTKLGATHNCKAKYHIIHLYRELEHVSTGDAIRALSGDLELNINAEIAHAINEIETDRSLNAEYTPPQLSLIIGRQLYDFLQRVDRDPVCIKAADKLEIIVDKAVEEADFNTLKMLYDTLPDTLLTAIQMYDERKETRTRQALV